MTPKGFINAALGSTIAAHQILGDSHDHSHSDFCPPERCSIFQNCLSAVTTTTTPNPADRLIRMSGCTND
jgi:hypothetical protein